MAGLIGKTKKPKHGLLRPKEFRRIVGKAGAVAIILILTRELVITGLRAIAADKGVVIAASYFGKFKTVSQIVAITYILLAGQFTALPEVLGTVLLWIAVIITVLSGADYLYKAKELFE